MREINRLADQLTRAMEGDAWHGPALYEVLEGITTEQATRYPIPEAHSIWEIVLHIATWHEAVRRRLGGTAWVPTETENWPPIPDPSPAAWQAAQDTLTASYQDLKEAMAQQTDDKLDEIVPGKSYTFYVMLNGVIQHDLYHTGQIILLKKGT